MAAHLQPLALHDDVRAERHGAVGRGADTRGRAGDHAIGQIPGYWGSHAEQKAEASCRQQKALNPASRCTVYYNTELGMEWDDSQKEVMTVAHQDLWLQ